MMDIKAFRENELKMSEKEFSELVGINIKKLKEWESGKASFDTMPFIQKITQKTDFDFNQILLYEKPTIKPIDVEYTWEKVDFTQKHLLEYVDKAINNKDLYISEKSRQKYLTDLKQGIEARTVKPSISIVGRSDAGKSTLINALIGMDKMPTSWTPCTAIAIYIKHTCDRPSFIKEDVWVFADSNKDEQFWNVKKLYDEEYCRSWKVAEGGADILCDIGTRKANSSTGAGSAVIFIDAPILLDCDIVDLPGYGTGEEKDDYITFGMAAQSDILIYLSQANGFLKQEDIAFLKRNIKRLPVWERVAENDIGVLGNLFIVASQAHTVDHGNKEELKHILDEGNIRLTKSLSAEYWAQRESKSGYEITVDHTRDRFFVYTTDIPDLCTEFEKELKLIIEKLPDVINERTMSFVRKFVERRRPKLSAEIKKYEEMIEEREKYVKLLENIESHELDHARKTDEYKSKVLDYIKEIEAESEAELVDFFSNTINTDSIIKMIKEEGIKNKKEELECFVSKLQEQIQDKCGAIIKGKTEALSEMINKYLHDYNEEIKAVFDDSSVDVDFDAGYNFAEALAKIGIIGGLGAWIAGDMAFFVGSYAFIMGLGGDLALFGTFLGPIGLGIGLAIGAGLGVIRLLGGGWQKNVAKHLTKAYDENNALEKYKASFSNYWSETREAFNKAAKSLDEDWERYVNQLREQINNYNIDDINREKKSMETIAQILDGIPL